MKKLGTRNMGKPTDDKFPSTIQQQGFVAPKKINYTQGEDVRVGRTNKHPTVEHLGHRFEMSQETTLNIYIV
jgi:hypothetical protein